MFIYIHLYLRKLRDNLILVILLFDNPYILKVRKFCPLQQPLYSYVYIGLSEWRLYRSEHFLCAGIKEFLKNNSSI